MTTQLLGATFDLYIKRRKRPGRYWSELENRFQKHLIPDLGGRTRVLSTITKAELRDLIETKEDQGYPVAARTTYEVLNPFFKWCLGKDLILSNPLSTLPPPGIPKSRDKILSESEIKAIWKATFDMPLWGPFYRLLMLTCQRRNEVAGIQYGEIYNNEWTIPGSRTKNGRSHLVHLSTSAMTIIESKPEFIGRQVSGFSKAKRTIDRLSGVKNWRIHDLRRTGATTMQRLGVLPDHIELILNHSSKGVKGIYQRFQYLEERKDALELLGLYLECL